MKNAGGCFVVAPGEGRLIGLREFEMRVKADAGSTRGLSVLETTEPPDSARPSTFTTMLPRRSMCSKASTS
jgi:hypothetical protein